MPQVVKLNSRDLGKLIRECVERVLNEGFENDVCPKLAARIKRFGDIRQINLPDRLNVRDLEDEDIDNRLSKEPKTEYSIKLASGYYVGVVPTSEKAKNKLGLIKQDAAARERRKAEVDAEPLSQAKRIPFQTPEEHAEEVKANGSPEKPLRFRSMKQVQNYIQEKYGQYLEFLTTRTRSGRDFVYQARITYIASSYADGPSYVGDDVVEKVTELLKPFGFYYAGNKEDHDERQWSTNGWHVWKREGAVDPYERWLMRQAYDELDPY
jgi:hypothetical protein